MNTKQPMQPQAVAVCVRDIDVSRSFYVEGLGGAVQGSLIEVPQETYEQVGVAPEGLTVLKIEFGDGFLLKLVQSPHVPPRRSERTSATDVTGVAYVTFGVQDVRGARDALVSLGARVLSDPDLDRMAFVEDPDGNIVELLHTP
jgi:catechol 2,3-dioxygenase-like lactoylglutathione lyase family enzyme